MDKIDLYEKKEKELTQIIEMKIKDKKKRDLLMKKNNRKKN